jgi:hypothetical protein
MLKGIGFGMQTIRLQGYHLLLPCTQLIHPGTYIFFAAWLVLAFAFYWFFIPETRGKTLEEMDAAFGSHSSQENVQELARIQAEIGLTALLSSSVTESFQSKEQELATHVEETRGD